MSKTVSKRDYFLIRLINVRIRSMYIRAEDVENYRFTPVFGYSFRMAPYVWFIIFMFLRALMKKDKKAVLIMVLPLAYLATCFLGPVATLRYIYNLVVCCPLYFYVMRENDG